MIGNAQEPNDDFASIQRESAATQSDQNPALSIAELSAQLTREKDTRHEHYFWILLLGFILLDCHFIQSNNIAAPTIIFVLELIMLHCLALKWGIDPYLVLYDDIKSHFYKYLDSTKRG
jgi:hypothetical protein